MRHRKVKHLEERIEATRHYIVQEAKEQKGHWRMFFSGLPGASAEGEETIGVPTCADSQTVVGAPDSTETTEPVDAPAYVESSNNDCRLYMELGCGKGKFLCTRAEAEPDAYFIGIEGLDAVLIRGLERANEKQIANVRFVMNYVSDIRDYFADGELDGIYLNFSDPWPKPRHAKRRFTYGDTLLKYKQILKPGGFVAFKTDNEELFDFTMEEIQRLGLHIEEMSRDLHASDYAAKNFTTEYEEKFHGKGKNINYILLRFPDMI